MSNEIEAASNRRHNNDNDNLPPVNTNRRRKRRRKKKNNYCGCGRIGFMASTVICFMCVYGIFMAISILYSVHHPKIFVKHSGGRTKEEQRDYLQKQYLQRSSKAQTEDKKALEKFRKKKTLKRIANFRPKYPKKIHFLHIHKSAGTFLCKQAFHNKMAADYKNNCNVRDDQRCCWYDSKHESWNEKIEIHNETKLLEDSIRFAKKAPFDFVATERELAGPMLVDHYDYVVSLRDSRARYKSHWQHLIRNAHQRKKNPQRDSKRGSKKKQIQPPPLSDYVDDPVHWNLTLFDPKDKSVHPVGNYTKWLAGQPDNYSLRMICGSPCVNVPKYQITQELFEHSLERLWTNFSHILFVENMEESYAKFATAYGWDPAMKTEKKKEAKTNDEQTAGNTNLAVPLHADPFLTVLDNAMYEFAQRKYKLENTENANLTWTKEYEKFQNQELVDLYFSEGPLKNCTNPCCGYCSKW